MAVQRSRALLTARTLTVNTGAAEGFTAPVSAATTRPVVAATWRRDVRRPGSDGPPPAGGSTRAEERRDTRTTPDAVTPAGPERRTPAPRSSGP